MRVFNIGSMNIDKVYSVDHLITPGETLASSGMETYVGGKGLNQSVALAAAGATVYHAGMIGEEGLFLKEYMESRGVNTQFVRTIEGVSGHTIIQVDKNGENNILLFAGANHCLTESFIDEVLEKAGPDDILLLQNEVNHLRYIMEQGAKKKLRIAFNPSPTDEKITELPLESVTWFILNEVEGEMLTGRKDPDEILLELNRKYPQSSVLLTLGGDGAVYCGNGEKVRQGIFPVTARDTTAAGDTFTGYFLAGVIRQDDIATCLRTAALASSIAVSREGAAPSIPDRAEVEEKDLQERK